MQPSNLRPFKASEEPEPLKQQLGYIYSPDRYYAVVRPEGAEPSDTEDKLLIRDDRFGAGIMQLDLDMRLPTALLSGRALPEGADAVLLTDDGYILMLRDGLMRVERIPGVAPENDDPTEWASCQTNTATVSDGKLFVSGSKGLIAVRDSVSSWAELHRYEEKAPTLMLDSLVVSKAGEILAAGSRDYEPTYLYSSDSRIWEEATLSGGFLTGAVSASDGNFLVLGSNGEIWLGHPKEGFKDIRPFEGSPEFDAVQSYKGKTYLSSAIEGLYVLEDGRLVQLNPFVGDQRFLIYSFDVHDDKLWMQGMNGFAMFDGESWTRIEVPW
ncbi:hypothetical protein RPE78_10815 [Thioclava litoralis]|uniref:PQQ-like domain-containing protein n=1 Tax=Thioclava litoralis TaxID=3076557 RepID=A0ABZ1DXN0_9RHOB|nr:hypothetical protein RPE78_10815 [Thioclava sp. FTW29]